MDNRLFFYDNDDATMVVVMMPMFMMFPVLMVDFVNPDRRRTSRSRLGFSGGNIETQNEGDQHQSEHFSHKIQMIYKLRS
jgi:hypothetical protein